jgi:alkylation response protein AidB-like acyl-CoA dehydrogenase
MNFGVSEEQELLRQQVRKFLDQQCPMEEVRRIMKSELGHSPEQWQALSQLGWAGLIIPESHGGAGLGWVDLIVVLEETGRSLFPSPLISSVLTAATLLDLGTPDQQARWLPGLAEGTRIGGLAIFDDPDHLAPDGIQLEAERDGGDLVLSGDKPGVVDITGASFFLVGFREANGKLGLAMVEADAEGVTKKTADSLDESKRIGTLSLSSTRVKNDAVIELSPDDDFAALRRIVERGAVAVSAEILGAGEGAHALTVQYAKDRTQFGHPIGHFQGVKHPLAEMYVDLECIRSLLYFAAWALDESPDEVSFAASKTKAFASEAFARIGVDGVQLHGAVGYTEEYDIQLYLKRSKWARPIFGDEDYHLDRVASIGGL